MNLFGSKGTTRQQQKNLIICSRSNIPLAFFCCEQTNKVFSHVARFFSRYPGAKVSPCNFCTGLSVLRLSGLTGPSVPCWRNVTTFSTFYGWLDVFISLIVFCPLREGSNLLSTSLWVFIPPGTRDVTELLTCVLCTVIYASDGLCNTRGNCWNTKQFKFRFRYLTGTDSFEKQTGCCRCISSPGKKCRVNFNENVKYFWTALDSSHWFCWLVLVRVDFDEMKKTQPEVSNYQTQGVTGENRWIENKVEIWLVYSPGTRQKNNKNKKSRIQ